MQYYPTKSCQWSTTFLPTVFPSTLTLQKNSKYFVEKGLLETWSHGMRLEFDCGVAFLLRMVYRMIRTRPIGNQVFNVSKKQMIEAEVSLQLGFFE